MITRIDLKQDFFKMYPNLKIAFREVISNFTHQEKLSKVMWTIVLLFHPISEYYELPFARRVEHVLTKYIKYNGDYDKFYATHKLAIETFKEFCVTKAQKALMNWEKKLEERDAFINSVPYNAETFEMLDKMMSSTDKMWTQYKKVLAEFEKEQDNIKNKGGVTLSPADEGEV